ncbi:hypothetical protein [Acinetobacter sp. T63]
MLLTTSLVLAILSFVIAKSIVKSKPEIANWSVNKKQAITLVWFALTASIMTLVKLALVPGTEIVDLMPGSLGAGVMFGIIFYKGLEQKGKPA